MPLPPNDIYRAHVHNLRSVETGIAHIERELRDAIARRDSASGDALLKILLLLTGGWAECRLKKLMYEPNGFSQQDRDAITGCRQQIEWWKKALDIGFRARYAVPNGALPGALRPMARLLYNELLSTIDSDLRPIIEMRNTLAHGQWSRPLNSSGDDIAPDMISALKKENALSARFKKTILESLAAILHDLVAGNAAFERDFDTHFTHLENARRNLKNREYKKWETSMIQKYDTGRTRRNSNLQDAH